MSVQGRVAVATAAVAAGAQVCTAATWLPAVRRRFPSLAGQGRCDHVALTFDDGPHPVATPLVLEVLDAAGVKATFFVVGDRVAQHPDIVRRCIAEGHEVAVHGWRHRYGLWRGLGVARAAALVAGTTGVPPTWFRPPYGVLSLSSLLAARAAGLDPVLWTVWARDWTASASPGSILDALTPGLVGGATVLLHDSDVFAANRSWRATVAALPTVIERCRAAGLTPGPLRDHGIGEVDRHVGGDDAARRRQPFGA